MGCLHPQRTPSEVSREKYLIERLLYLLALLNSLK